MVSLIVAAAVSALLALLFITFLLHRFRQQKYLLDAYKRDASKISADAEGWKDSAAMFEELANNNQLRADRFESLAKSQSEQCKRLYQQVQELQTQLDEAQSRAEAAEQKLKDEDRFFTEFLRFGGDLP